MMSERGLTSLCDFSYSQRLFKVVNLARNGKKTTSLYENAPLNIEINPTTSSIFAKNAHINRVCVREEDYRHFATFLTVKGYLK